MLTIPNSVKTLYKTDGVHKNFRVHFPNGELTDITNDDVVRESLHFTESLCSQDVFKFGLAEASVLEFETVGVSNMYGMTIEASIEIDCSSLSAADKATIAGGTWDGTWDGVNEVFAIPLGTFRVDSCPRDHQSMTHRKVTAYSLAGGMKVSSPFEEAKLRIQAPTGSTYSPNAHRLIYAAFGWDNPDALSGLTKSLYDTWTNLPTGTAYKYRTSGSYTPQRSYIMELTITRRVLQFGSVIDADSLYSLEIGATHYDTVYSDVKTWLDAQTDIRAPAAFLNHISTSLVITLGEDKMPTLTGYPVFYPEYAGDVYIYVPESVVVQVTQHNQGGTDQVVFNRAYSSLVDSPALYEYSDSFSSLSITVDPTGTNAAGTRVTYVDAYDINDLLASYVEVVAEFGKSDRGRGMLLFRLDNTSPVSVLPENYSEMWWDEYDVDAIGTVKVGYTDAGGSSLISDISIGSGSSLYDMSDNELMGNLTNGSYSSVESIITTEFAPHVGTAVFTPVELTMEGWPWLEAGDALQITAEDGTVVDTYALRVEMSGIQNLQAAITAHGGEIIGEV